MLISDWSSDVCSSDLFAATLREIATRIPDDLNWVLQVEGHTDTVPINNEQFRSNWELSAARAISVVKFLVEQGIPAERLSATGYGAYQPITPGDLERNRRLEMKPTQRLTTGRQDKRRGGNEWGSEGRSRWA